MFLVLFLNLCGNFWDNSGKLATWEICKTKIQICFGEVYGDIPEEISVRIFEGNFLETIPCQTFWKILEDIAWVVYYIISETNLWVVSRFTLDFL